MSIEIFYSYSHKDEALREELEKQLSLLRWQGLISSWHDRRILAGQEWAGKIDSYLNTAQIILLLVSPDFMASNYCYGIEVKRAMERHEQGEALVIPIILRPVYWQGASFGKLQALPRDGKAVTDPDWYDLDRAFFNVAEGIRRSIEIFSDQSLSTRGKQGQSAKKESVQIIYEPLVNDLEKFNTSNRIAQRFGNYRLIRLLGKGSFSDVYLAEHQYIASQAAVKVLRTEVMDMDIASFNRGLQSIVKLVHPHIVRIFDFGVEEGIPFLVMDYAPHGTLRQRHPRGSKIPLATVVSYVKQIADALQFAHDRRHIHRDIKPENMLIGWMNEVLLSDFALTSVNYSTDAIKPLEVMAGTVPYMAPEQLQGRPRSASDQYALGIVVYEWLCGAYPFDGSTTEIMSQHMIAPSPTLRDKIAVPRQVELVIMKALAKEPHRRFDSVQAFASALDEAAKS